MRPLGIKVRGVKETPPPITQHQEKFWTNASGSFKLSAERLHNFLKKRGYGTHRPKNVKTVILVKVENKIIKQVNSKDIRAVCWNYINNEYSFSDPDERCQIKDEFQRNRSFFSKDNLDLLPLIFTTNIEEQDWPEFLGDPISTSAILDRIFHHSVIVRIKGLSYRKHQGELLQEEYAEKKKGNVETGE